MSVVMRLKRGNNNHWRQLPTAVAFYLLFPCWHLLVISNVYQPRQVTVQAFSTKDPLPGTVQTCSPSCRRTLTSIVAMKMSSRTWIDGIGSSALRNVENLAQSVTRANDENLSTGGEPQHTTGSSSSIQSRNTGDTAKLFNTAQDKQILSDGDSLISSNDEGDAIWNNKGGALPITVGGETVSTAAGSVITAKGKNRKVVLSALESLERDMQLLDNITAQKPQLSRLEITLLSFSVVAAGSGPVFFMDGAKVAEVLAPACAACK
jgi:hypothetical protein